MIWLIGNNLENETYLMPESSAWSKRFWPWSKQKFYFINWQIDHGQNCFDHTDDSGICRKFFCWLFVYLFFQNVCHIGFLLFFKADLELFIGFWANFCSLKNSWRIKYWHWLKSILFQNQNKIKFNFQHSLVNSIR